MLPQGDEPVRPLNEARLVLVAATRTVLANGLACSGSPPPSGCEDGVRAHEAGWAHAEAPCGGPAWLREPADPNELVRHLWSTTARKVDGALEVGGVR